MAFCLKVKSDYSFLSSTIRIDDMISFCIKNNLKYASLIDNNLFGALPFYNTCISNNIRPIIGIELNVRFSDVVFPIIFIAKSEIGYKNISKLSSIANKYQQTSIDFKILSMYAQDVALVLSSEDSYLTHLISNNQIFEANEFIDAIKDSFKDEEIPFIIEDGILKHVDGLSETIYINQEVKPYEIVFTEKIENYTVKMDEMAIVFTNDGVYIKMAFANAGIVNFSEHEYLKNLDFSDKTVLSSDDFWNNIFSITDKVLDSYKPIYIVGYGFYYLFYWFMWLAIFCLIMAFFSKMRTMGLIKFWELFKMSIYGLTPFVICAVFSSLFNLEFLVYIGYLISAIYNIITVNEIIKNNFATRREG